MDKKRIVIEIQGELDVLRIVWSLLEEILEGIPEVRHREDERYMTLVAVQEAATNVLRHAYEGDLTLPIRFELKATGPMISITIVDHGPPFDPEKEEKVPDEENPAEGGYGIYIIKSVMDKVIYDRREGKNFLTMIKDFSFQTVWNTEEGGSP